MATYSPKQLNRMFWVHDELRRIAKTIHRLDENACNYGLTPRQETRQANLLKRAEELAQELGLHAYHQGDPRGCSLYLVEIYKESDCDYTQGTAITF